MSGGERAVARGGTPDGTLDAAPDTAPSAVRDVSASALYRGVVTHHRHAVALHSFSYSIAMAYIDLDELPRLLGGALLDRGMKVTRFRRSDYFGDPARPLADEVRDRVGRQTGRRPSGPIRLLTQLRSFGHCFNPISLYYCLSGDGERIEALLAEVTNTPWGERHAYVLAPREGSDRSTVQERPATGPEIATGEVEKALHVSPFIGMEQTYEWRASTPGDSLSVRISSRRRARSAHGASRDASARDPRPPVGFHASLSLVRTPLSRRSLAAASARYPTIRTLALIYLQAAKIRLKGVPVRPHPRS